MAQARNSFTNTCPPIRGPLCCGATSPNLPNERGRNWLPSTCNGPVRPYGSKQAGSEIGARCQMGGQTGPVFHDIAANQRQICGPCTALPLQICRERSGCRIAQNPVTSRGFRPARSDRTIRKKKGSAARIGRVCGAPNRAGSGRRGLRLNAPGMLMPLSQVAQQQKDRRRNEDR